MWLSDLALLVFKDVLRNPVRSIGVMAGCLLAVSLIAGANLSVEATMQNLLDTSLARTPIDALISHSSGTEPLIGTTSQKLASIEGVQSVFTISITDLVVEIGPYTTKGEVIGVSGLGETVNNIADILNVDAKSTDPGSGFPPDLGLDEVVLYDRHVQEAANQGLVLGEGDMVRFLFSTPNRSRCTRHLQVTGLRQTPSPELEEEGGGKREGGDGSSLPGQRAVLGLGRPVMVLDLEASLSICRELGIDPTASSWVDPGTGDRSLFSRGVCHLVFYDRVRLIEPGRLFATLHNFGVMGDRVQSSLPLSGLTSNNLVNTEISEYRSKLSSARPTYLTGALPGIVLGIYVALIGAEIAHSSRKRETALLKTHGFDSKTLRDKTLLETGILGVTAGLLGLLLSLVTVSSIYTLTATPINTNPATGFTGPIKSGVGNPFSLIHTAISGQSILFAAVLGVFMLSLATARSMFSMKRIELAESLGGYSPTVSRKPYTRKRLDLALLSIPVVSYCLIGLAAQNGQGPLNYSLLSMILDMFTSIAMVLIPITPLLLIMGGSSLLTRASSKPYQAVTRALPFLGRTKTLVSKSLSAHTDRSSRQALLIGLSLALATFLLTYHATNRELQVSRIMFNTGADIKIGPIKTDPDQVREELTKTEGVGEVAVIRLIDKQTLAGNQLVLEVNPQHYLATITGNPFYEALAESLKKLAGRQDTILVQQAIAKNTGWEEGDKLSISLKQDIYEKLTPEQSNTTLTPGQPLEFHMAGVFPHLPGIPQTMKIDPWRPPILLTSKANLKAKLGSLLNQTEIIALARVSPGTDPHTVSQSLYASNHPYLHTKSGRVTVLQDQVKRFEEDPYQRSLTSFTYMVVGFTFIAAIVGSVLILISQIRQRTRELGAAIARGFTHKQARKIIIGESLVLGIMASAIGPPTGMITATIYTQITEIPTGLTIPVTPIYPWTILLATFILLATTGLVAFIAGTRMSRTELGGILRIGH